MNILFTTVGKTDPITNCHDGAMLHICRYYDIDKAYLYMSKEICEHQASDQRYTYCLEKLGEWKGKKIEYELIERPDLVDVQVFDSFYDEFREKLIAIHSEFPDATIYLNVSSGTPAMKSTLQILETILDFELLPIQVSTPAKRSNIVHEDSDNYDVELQWEFNDDNKNSDDPESNRCSKSRNASLMSELNKLMLIDLLNHYDYMGALQWAETMEKSLNPEIIDLLTAAFYRSNLKYADADKIFGKYNYKLLKASSEDRKILEYYLQIVLRVKKGEYADFLRSITPFIVNLFERILKDMFSFDVSLYKKNNGRRDAGKWDMEKLKKSEPKVYSVLKERYAGDRTDVQLGYVLSDNLECIINERFVKSANQRTIGEKVAKVRNFEEDIRNTAAHEMQYVDEERIKKETGMSPAQFLDVTQSLLNATGIRMPEAYLGSYDDMNRFIIEEIKKVKR